MTSRVDSYLDKISDLFNRYIEAYPQEADKLAVLSRQLQERDEKLNDRKNMVGHLTASALVINKDDHCLLIYHRFLKRWLQPGGHLDEGEMPELGALRELKEETGIEAVTVFTGAAVLGPIDIDSHAIPQSSAKQEGSHLHHDFQYIFRLDQADEPEKDAIKLQENEVSDHKWASLDELASGIYGQRLARVAAKLSQAKITEAKLSAAKN